MLPYYKTAYQGDAPSQRRNVPLRGVPNEATTFPTTARPCCRTKLKMRLPVRSIPPQNISQHVLDPSTYFSAINTAVAVPTHKGVHALYTDECCEKIAKQRRKNIKEMNHLFGYNNSS